MKYLIAVPLFILAGIPLTLLGGVVLADLWRWFVIPVFEVPTLTYLQAVGLSLFVGFFKIGLATTKHEEHDEAPIMAGVVQLFGVAIAILILWGIAAIWSLFI